MGKPTWGKVAKVLFLSNERRYLQTTYSESNERLRVWRFELERLKEEFSPLLSLALLRNRVGWSQCWYVAACRNGASSSWVCIASLDTFWHSIESTMVFFQWNREFWRPASVVNVAVRLLGEMSHTSRPSIPNSPRQSPDSRQLQVTGDHSLFSSYFCVLSFLRTWIIFTTAVFGVFPCHSFSAEAWFGLIELETEMQLSGYHGFWDCPITMVDGVKDFLYSRFLC